MLTSDDDFQLREAAAQTLGADAEEINDDTSPQTLAAWTSYAHLSLMAAVEEAFGLTFSMDEMTHVRTFGDLRALVARHRA